MPSLRYSCEQLRRDAGQLHPLQDKAFLDAEAAGHLGGGLALVDQRGERLELVGRVHRQPDGVFGKAHFQGVLLGDDLARHGEILRQLAFGLQRVDRLQAAAAGDDAIRAVAGVGDDEVLHQAVREERRLQLVHADLGGGAAGIERGFLQPADGDELGLSGVSLMYVITISIKLMVENEAGGRQCHPPASGSGVPPAADSLRALASACCWCMIQVWARSSSLAIVSRSSKPRLSVSFQVRRPACSCGWE